MGANFTPTFGAYSPLTPFRYWCQKVLPLVYDDSLSYYECLNKTVDYLNKTMEDVETLHGDTEAMLAAFNQLQTYVNTYFDELDLTEEVQTVLDRMAENGSLDELLRPLVGEQIGGVVAEQIDDAVAGQIYNTVASQINAVIAEQLPGVAPGVIGDWLDEHVTPGSGVVDNTLSIAGAGADAKTVGEDFAKAFVTTEIYFPGQIVLYNGKLYKFTAIHNKGSWIGTDTEEIAVGTELNRLFSLAKNAYDITKGEEYSNIEFTPIKAKSIEYRTGNELTTNDFCSTDFIDISAYKEIKYSRLYVGSSAVSTGAAYYDKDKTYISGIRNMGNAESIHYEDYTSIVPNNAVYFRATFSANILADDVYIQGKTKLYDVIKNITSGTSALANEANTFDDTKTYYKNDIVLYADNLYKFIGDKLPGAWDSNVVEQITIGDELSDAINTAKTTEKILLSDSDIALKYKEAGSGSIHFFTGGVTSSTVYNYTDYVDISNYQEIMYRRIGITGASATGGVAIYDKNKNYLYGIRFRTGSEDFGYFNDNFAVTEDAKYARFTTIKDTENNGLFAVYGKSIFVPSKVMLSLELEVPFTNNRGVNFENGIAIASLTTACSSDYVYCHDFDIVKYKNMCITASSTSLGMCFFDENKNAIPGGGKPWITNASERQSKYEYAIIPSNAYYIKFSYPNHANMAENATDMFNAVFYKIGNIDNRIGKLDGLTETGLGLHYRKPKTKGIANAIKRAYQLSNATWTAKLPFTRMIKLLDGTIGTSVFPAGVTYTGIPYSVTPDRRHSINIDCGLDTFYSAIANEKSRMYDQSIATYNSYAYYGNVCSSYVQAVFGLKTDAVTKDMDTYPLFYKAYNSGRFDEYSLELGDMFLHPNDHTALVTGILYDDNGVIQYIEISEETLYGYITGGYARSKWWRPDDIFTRFSVYDIYRYKYIDDVEYSPNNNVQVLPEEKMYIDNELKIYPVYGNGCVLGVSSLTFKLAISDDAYALGYRNVIACCNGEIIYNNTIDENTTSVSIPRTTEGEYIAYLTDGNGGKSKAAFFTIVSGTFSVVRNGDVATLTFNTNYNIYGLAFNRSSVDAFTKYVPCKPLTGNGTYAFNVPSDATNLAVIIGTENGVARKAL